MHVRQPIVLYVDDEPANLAVFEMSCGDSFEVVTAGSGAEALAIVREREVGVLLTDQRMPGMSGIDLAEAVRLEQPEAIRLLITGYSDLTAAVDAINRGQVRRYLKKPWELHELRSALRESLELYETTRRLHALEGRLFEVERVYALGVVAAGIAHELRNPLSWITANLSVLKEGLAALQTDLLAPTPDTLSLARRLPEFLEAVGDAVEGASRITEIARGIELSTRSQRDDDLVDLNEVVTLTVRSVQGELRKRARLDLAIDVVPAVRGSRTKLGQVALNLLVNALQALPDRPRAENLVSVRLFASEGSVRLEVQDNGAGVPPEVRSRLFDPFFTTKKQGGTGLGLAISKKIAEEHGGQIGVVSEPGHGATFTIVLPVAAAAPADRPSR